MKLAPTPRTGFVFCPEYLVHQLGPGHPESPLRLKAILDELESTGLVKKLARIDPLPIQDVIPWIEEIHSRDHLRSIEECGKTRDASFLAVAGVLAAIDAIARGQIANAFCAVRPPGHHAHNNGAHYDGRCQGEGFCFLNNVAIAARYLQRKHNCRRILILDWDFHHGNGTEWAFYEDPTVFYFSTHSASGYPGSGSPHRRGSGPGEGFNLNIPLQPGASDQDILLAWEDGLIPALDEVRFRPDFVLISAGFDSRADDLLGDFGISDKGFGSLTAIAMDIAAHTCGGRLVSVLEGGYAPNGLAKAVTAHIEVLLGNYS